MEIVKGFLFLPDGTVLRLTIDENTNEGFTSYGVWLQRKQMTKSSTDFREFLLGQVNFSLSQETGISN